MAMPRVLPPKAQFAVFPIFSGRLIDSKSVGECWRRERRSVIVAAMAWEGGGCVEGR